MTDKRSSPVKAIIGADKVVGLMTEDGLNVPGFDGTGYVTDEELEERLEPASLSDLKAGISTKKPIVPLRQHQSVFYGLAKAAGANLASSTEETAPDGTNPGVYPTTAKTAIKNMLGISDVCIPGIGYDSIQQKITDPEKVNTASGVKSAAFGSQNTASGRDAFAEGSTNVASGNYSHVEGFENSATQPAAHAEGQRTKSQGVASHAEGQNTTANGQGAHAEGIEALANANAAHAEGQKTVANNSTAHAEGYQSTASGYAAHSEGDRTTASGQSAHAEGYQSTASGYAAHAENKSTASGTYSHAGGWGSTAIQDCCFAHGREVQARSARSAAFGNGTIASTNDQMVVGRFNNNILTGSLFVVGNGTSDSQRSNAFEVLAGGSIKIGNTTLTEAQLQALLAFGVKLYQHKFYYEIGDEEYGDIYILSSDATPYTTLAAVPDAGLWNAFSDVLYNNKLYLAYQVKLLHLSGGRTRCQWFITDNTVAAGSWHGILDLTINDSDLTHIRDTVTEL